MEKKHRSRTDMIAAVLQASLEGTNFTKMMFNAYMSYQQCCEYISWMLERELMEYDKKKRTYTTTDKGKEFLGIYEKIRI